MRDTMQIFKLRVSSRVHTRMLRLDNSSSNVIVIWNSVLIGSSMFSSEGWDFVEVEKSHCTWEAEYLN